MRLQLGVALIRSGDDLAGFPRIGGTGREEQRTA
jgi:hypothetical protein